MRGLFVALSLLVASAALGQGAELSGSARLLKPPIDAGLQDNFPEIPNWMDSVLTTVFWLVDAGLYDFMMGYPDIPGAAISACERLRDPEKLRNALANLEQNHRTANHQLLSGLKQLIRLYGPEIRFRGHSPEDMLLQVHALSEGSAKPFVDVPAGHWAEPDLTSLRGASLIRGYGTGPLPETIPDSFDNFDLYSARASLLRVGACDLKPGELYGVASKAQMQKMAVDSYLYFQSHPDARKVTVYPVHRFSRPDSQLQVTKSALSLLTALIDRFRPDLAAAGHDPTTMKLDVLRWLSEVKAVPYVPKASLSQGGVQ